ncbi:MAG: hypothetical protein K0Q49_2181, partial [Haloplasmataceae bacterium]|nr:hypothetical protein [Haloplasmataceae bacterium]
MIKKWEIIGIFIIIFLGVSLHFAYDYFDHNQFVGLIAPVNESVWEHLKMTFYAMTLFAAIEYIFLNKEGKNFLFAKAFSSLLACFLVVVIYYGYTKFMDHNLYLDILTFVLAVVIAQLFSYFIIKIKLFLAGINYIGVIVLFLAVMLFS